MTTKQNWKVAAALAIGVWAISPAAWADSDNPDWRTLDVGMIETGGITMTSMMPGQTFRYQTGGAFTPDSAIDCTNYTPAAAEYVEALKAGAKVVKIEVSASAMAAGQEQQSKGHHRAAAARVYYGVLALCKIHKSAAGPASRTYSIQVPQQILEKAQDGFVAVVGEKVAVARYGWQTPSHSKLSFSDFFKMPAPNQGDQQGMVQEDFSWILWVTDRAPTFTEAIPATTPAAQH